MANDPWSYAEKTKSEFAEQVALFMWANMARLYGPVIADDPISYNKQGFAKTQFENAGKLGYKVSSEPVPELEWLHAIKNQGHGDKIRGNLSKMEGVKAGVPDMMLPVPIMEHNAEYANQFEYHGLYIELKRLKSERGQAGVASEVQTKWHNYLSGAGYKVVVCHGWLVAKQEILAYLGR